MTWFRTALEFIYETLLAEFVVVVAGVLFAQFIKRYFDKWRYGKWRVTLVKDGKTELDKAISPGKAKAILDIPEDLAVYLKGLISPFAYLRCDLMEDGPCIGLLNIDRKSRRIEIDLDKNPIDLDAAAPGEPLRDPAL